MFDNHSVRAGVMTILAVLAIVILPACSREETQQPAQKKTGLFVINVLFKPFYDDCHIKGSINVPFPELETFVQNLDPENTEIVVYCSNYMCTSSGQACKRLKELGFKKVWAYEGGTAEWHQKKLPVEGPCQRPYLTKENVQHQQEGQDAGCVITAEDLAKKLQV